MKEKDRDKFIEAMTKDVEDQTRNGNFSLVKRNLVPKDKTILKAVWQMRRKRDIRTREIKKYMARLNIDGSRMIHGVNYNETYAPVAQWTTIIILLVMGWYWGYIIKMMDFKGAYLHAKRPENVPIYLKPT